MNTRNYFLNLRGGVSSETIIAIGPERPSQPFMSEALILWKDHHSESARFITRSALTAYTYKDIIGLSSQQSVLRSPMTSFMIRQLVYHTIASTDSF